MKLFFFYSYSPAPFFSSHQSLPLPKGILILMAVRIPTCVFGVGPRQRSSQVPSLPLRTPKNPHGLLLPRLSLQGQKEQPEGMELLLPSPPERPWFLPFPSLIFSSPMNLESPASLAANSLVPDFFVTQICCLQRRILTGNGDLAGRAPSCFEIL